MIIGCSDFLKDLKKIYPPASGLRKNSGTMEFAIQSIYGLAWFPCYQLPEKASSWVKALEIFEGSR